VILIQLNQKNKIDKEKIIYLHRLFRDDDDESIAKQDIKLTTS